MTLLNDKGDEFEWPCDRRDAHGRHGPIEFVRDGRGRIVRAVFCEGVKAHPLTQIGGNYR